MVVPKPRGTSIRIFLADGQADGVWVVEKSNWTGKALMAPRTRYGHLRARLGGPGVYLLIGPTESGLPPNRVYIGETDDLLVRLDSHHNKKDFWNRAVVFTSKDENLNKAHIRYLEARLIELAKTAKRAELDNTNVGSPRLLSEPDTAEVEAFLDEMLLIYPVLGIQVFHTAETQPTDSARLRFDGQDTRAKGNETADGFVVYEGSLARAAAVPSMPESAKQVRAALVARGLLVEAGKHLRLTQDYEFSSASAAANVMVGGSVSGPEVWKSSEGLTLKSLRTRDTSES